MDLLQDLQWRGIIYQQTDEEGLKEQLQKEATSSILWCRSYCRQYAYWSFTAVLDFTSFSTGWP